MEKCESFDFAASSIEEGRTEDIHALDVDGCLREVDRWTKAHFGYISRWFFSYDWRGINGKFKFTSP